MKKKIDEIILEQLICCVFWHPDNSDVKDYTYEDKLGVYQYMYHWYEEFLLEVFLPTDSMDIFLRYEVGVDYPEDELESIVNELRPE